MVEYTRYKLKNVIEAAGSLESREMEIDEDEAEELMKRVRKAR